MVGKSLKIKHRNDELLIQKEKTKTPEELHTSLSLGSSLRARLLPLSSTTLSSRLRFSSSATLALRRLSSKHSSSSERPVRRASITFSLAHNQLKKIRIMQLFVFTDNRSGVILLTQYEILLAQFPLNDPLVLPVGCHVFQCAVNITGIKKKEVHINTFPFKSGLRMKNLLNTGLTLSRCYCC